MMRGLFETPGLAAALFACTLGACAGESTMARSARLGTHLSATAEGAKAVQIMTAFGQGDAGNCASIAVIKLALFHYGYEGTFRTVGDTSTPFVLRDGRSVAISADDVKRVAALADFQPNAQGDPTIADHAITMLTVMARNKCAQGGPCASVADAFDPSAHFLDESTDKNFDWLGLEGDRRGEPAPAATSSLSARHEYVVTNMVHAAFAFSADYDEHGRVESVNDFEGEHSSWWTRLWGLRHINGVFTLKP